MCTPFEPTEEQIKAAKLEIQETWTPALERKRRVTPAKEDNVVPVVKLEDVTGSIDDM